MFHDLSGLLSAILVLISCLGIIDQIRVVNRRRTLIRDGLLPRGKAAENLSLYYISASFSAFAVMLLYGCSLRPLNHYLIWPRFVACLLLAYMLAAMAIDRRDRKTFFALLSSICPIIAACIIIFFGITVPPVLIVAIQTATFGISGLLFTGNLHQIRAIRYSRTPGAVSVRMHQLYFLKDAATVAFGISMGTNEGWPLMVMFGVNALMKLVIIFQIFYYQSELTKLRPAKEAETCA